jgi:pimeloyl-ACP methyl ester carboxylesterase
VNGTRLYYEAAGRGPPVVLLHAGNLDRRVWDARFPPLAREHRVVRCDPRGCGRSGGGRVAIDFALAYPDRVDRLVLAAPGLSGWAYRDRGDAAALGTAWLGSAYVRPAVERAALVAPLRAMAAANGRAWMGLLRRGDHERVVAPRRSDARRRCGRRRSS